MLVVFVSVLQSCLNYILTCINYPLHEFLHNFIGLQDSTLVESFPGFQIGVTISIFHCVGISVIPQLMLNIYKSSFFRESGSSCSYLEKILSFPEDIILVFFELYSNSSNVILHHSHPQFLFALLLIAYIHFHYIKVCHCYFF